ncbi:calcium-binding protein [Novosphingobium sp. PS1R-30]|uniref:Calcium-binding protein n=1 Tax=Novosphingobium anseongense TaxID=3133436 RepID=A0ABU8RPT2_9SPHN
MTAPITSELNLATRFGVLVSGTGAADTITPDSAPPGQPLVGAGPDLILALGGDDLLDGGFGADLMLGGDGDDTYVVDDFGDLVMEFPFGGWDTVRSSISYSLDAAPDTRFTVENLALTGAAAIDGTGNSLDNLLTGNAAANVLDGRAGNDRIDGGAGADTMIGGLGDDTFYVDNIGDRVIERAGEGNDRIYSRVEYNLTGQAVETLVLIGTASANGFGNELDNTLIGNAEHNYLDGLAGADVMRGGGGDDAYSVDDLGDVVDETYGTGIDAGGHDQIFTSVSISLTGTARFVEDVTVYRPEPVTVIGNDLVNFFMGGYGDDTLDGGGNDDRIWASVGNDRVFGGDGNDDLDGYTGDDEIFGGAGRDYIRGSEGLDRLTGGTGPDVFRFFGFSTTYSGFGADSTLATINTITDFNRAEGDVLELRSGGFAGKLAFRGEVTTPGFSLTAGAALGGEDLGPGFSQIWSHREGETTYLIGDLNDNRRLDLTDMVVAMNGPTAPLVLAITDFIPGSFTV